MREKLSELKSILGNTQDYRYLGMSVFLLTNEQEDYKIYRLNFQSNEKFKDALTESVLNIDNDIQIYYYPECIKPNITQEVSYIKLEDIPIYNKIIERIDDFDSTEVLNNKNIESIISTSKSYVVKYAYSKGNEDGEIFAFYKMTASSFYKREKMMFGFDNEDGDSLKEIKTNYLKFDNKLVGLAIGDYMFIVDGVGFGRLFKYDEHINKASQNVLQTINEKSIISNFDELESYCNRSKIMKSKLYQIQQKGTADRYGIDEFKAMKERCGSKLKLKITDNNKIEILLDDKRKSIDHLLRVLNNEGAETIIDGNPIFVEKKVLL